MKKIIGIFLILCSTCWSHEKLELLIGSEEIQQKIVTTAQQINKDYRGEELTIVMLMKGALCVSADLIRNLDVPFTVEYIRASSYGENGTTAGELKITGLETNVNFAGKNILLVDDVFDRGNTMTAVVSLLQKKNPKSIKTLVAFLKDVPRSSAYTPDYVLFEIPDLFVVGYGMDYKEYYRGLPGVYAVIID